MLVAFNRQIVNINMTCQAVRELFKHLLGVCLRCLVAHAARRNLAVLGMTFIAADLAVLALRSFPLFVDIAVASVAGFQLYSLRKLDCQRLVNRVASHAGGFGLVGKMWFVTFRTLRNVTVTAVVTAVTGLLSVLARETAELGCF